ncbi:MAG: helix-turn-helix transcriptional regulator [Ruminococcaceae bacterium]|nr:helix-turn-helix transcriptional regulator [Oscillospiraceae bacterium]
MGIGRRIRMLRERANITQEELALRIGVTPSAVGNYEREVSHPREDVLYKLFDVLHCQPNELFADCYTDLSPESELIEKYRALDDYGRELVQTCADIEYRRCTETVTMIAARGGTAPKRIVMRKRKGAGSVLDLPDYDGGR